MTRHRIPFLIALAVITAMTSQPIAAAQEVADLQVNSSHYIVVDANTGEVYAQRGASDQVAIASLTKLFTAVQALSMAPLDTVITTDESDMMTTEATTMGFGVGETYTLQDMIYGMMLPSGNDAAHAIARSLGYQEGDSPDESVARFMGLVNQRVQNMGLEDTNLVNPDGWGVEGHYSSAWDVAAFMQYALQYPFLVDVMGTSSYTTSNGAITVSNSNKMLNSYSPLLAGKTGFDNDAGWCLVNVAESGGTQMIAVTLDGVAPDDWYDDNRVLLDYGFQRKSEIATSGDEFNGDTLAWSDPDAAQLANAGEIQTSLQGDPAAPSRSGYTPPARSDGQIIDRTAAAFSPGPSSAGPWLAVTAAVALVGARGALHWRDKSSAESRAIQANPVDITPPDSYYELRSEESLRRPGHIAQDDMAANPEMVKAGSSSPVVVPPVSRHENRPRHDRRQRRPGTPVTE